MINTFRGEHRFLSNFYKLSIPIIHKGITYWTTENFFQAAKTLNMDERLAISKVSAGQSKKLGRKATLRPDWEIIKVIVMTYALNKKFSDPQLKQKLEETKPHKLVEGNTWGDTYWGVDRRQGGHNMLGRLLMMLRDQNL